MCSVNSVQSNHKSENMLRADKTRIDQLKLVQEDLDQNDNKINNKFPFDIKYVDKKLNEELLQDFHGEKYGFIQVGPEKYFFPSLYAQDAQHYYNMEIRSDDIWVVSFPRTGTTLTQELVWMVANDLNYKKALESPQVERFPFLEFSFYFNDGFKGRMLQNNSHSKSNQNVINQMAKPAWEMLSKQSSPRFIKTHLPFSLLPPDVLTKGCKVFYVARNPKDVAVSYYHLSKGFQTVGFQGDFKKFWDYFEKDQCLWMPFWSHIEEGWQERNNPNVMFLFYEEIVEDMCSIIQKVAKFLGKTYSDSKIDELKNYLDIKNFRKNPSVNMDALKRLSIIKPGEQEFIRKGKINGWDEEFTPELNKRADEWIKKNLRKTDLRFPRMKDAKIE